MPLTATLLALVQVTTPAEPPDCAVYEGWFDYVRDVRGQTGELVIAREVSFDVYGRLFQFDWELAHREFANLRQPNGEQLTVPNSILNQISALEGRTSFTCDWASIGHGPIRSTETVERPRGDRLEDGSVAFSPAVISDDRSSALVFVSLRGGRQDEVVLLEQQSGGRWQVTGRQGIHNP